MQSDDLLEQIAEARARLLGRYAVGTFPCGFPVTYGRCRPGRCAGNWQKVPRRKLTDVLKKDPVGTFPQCAAKEVMDRLRVWLAVHPGDLEQRSNFRGKHDFVPVLDVIKRLD